jgi:capsular polysaccharide biosynthesis protein
MYAWDVCRALFGDLKVIIANGAAPEFQAYLLNAAGVPDRDIIRLRYVARCKRLLLATQSLGVERYASPTSARLWSTIRDRSAVRDVSLPDRIYLSRSGIKDRKLLNETDVERVFERHGFTIIRLETLKPEKQIGLVSNALLVAGTSGSSMFNLAFQGRMRSAFILMWEERIQLSERLFSVGHNCDLWYHLGHRALFGTTEMGSWIVDLARLESDVADWLAQTGV